jgi:hypothetical protein
VDISGVCCLSALPPSGQCCVDAEVDSCGVCGGTHTCRADVSFIVTPSADPASFYLSKAIISNVLGVLEASIDAITVTVNSDGTVTVSFTLLPPVSLSTSSVVAALQQKASMIPGAAAITIDPSMVLRVPECGNRLCELGEQRLLCSNSTGACSMNPSSCATDCAFSVKRCPMSTSRSPTSSVNNRNVTCGGEWSLTVGMQCQSLVAACCFEPRLRTSCGFTIMNQAMDSA